MFRLKNLLVGVLLLTLLLIPVGLSSAARPLQAGTGSYEWTLTPRPGAVNALTASVIDLEGHKITAVYPDGWITYRGDYWADIPSPQSVEFGFEVTGPCGTFYAEKFTVADVQPGTRFVLAPGYFNIPDDACLGQYMVTFGATYNTTSLQSSAFMMLAPTPTPTATTTRTRTSTRTRTPTPTATPTFTPDGNWLYCAGENKTCNLPATRLVRFGANALYKFQTLTGSFVCNATTFGGDPAPGIPKHCAYNINPNEPMPTSTPTRTGSPTNTATATATATSTEPSACTGEPAQPVLVSPKDDVLIRKGQATLRWEAAECADTYKVIIREQQTDAHVEKKAGLTALEYQTHKLKPAHAYQWQVVAINAFGSTGSKWRELRTK